jgi:hypothetical protein
MRIYTTTLQCCTTDDVHKQGQVFWVRPNQTIYILFSRFLFILFFL